MENNFIIDYAYYTDLSDDIKNNLIIDYANDADLQDYIKTILSLTTLTTLICKTTLKIT